MGKKDRIIADLEDENARLREELAAMSKMVKAASTLLKHDARQGLETREWPAKDSL